jgi:hypothetical protein
MSDRERLAGLVLRVLRDPRLVLWSLFVIFFPFYAFASGLPQPADWVLVVLAPLAIRSWNGRMPRDMVRPYKALLMFTAYVVGVNLLWSVIEFEFTFRLKEGFLLSPLFYVYNALMLLTFLLMFGRYGEFLLWLTVRLVLVSVGIQLAIAVVVGGGARSSLFFNSPNQLGYYAVLSAGIILIGQRKLGLSTLATTFGTLGAAYLALLSSSKAALASIGMLGIALMLTRFRSMLVAFLVLTVLIFTPNRFSDAIDRAHDRIVNDESRDFIEERGYDRIINNPEYTIFGAGEGGYKRFRDSTEIGSHEIHSSIGTLIFCYGLVGTVLFGLFVLLSLQRAELQTWIVMGPAFAYGMTHQGLRFTMFWVLIGVAVGLRHLALTSRGKSQKSNVSTA